MLVLEGCWLVVEVTTQVDVGDDVQVTSKHVPAQTFGPRRRLCGESQLHHINHQPFYSLHILTMSSADLQNHLDTFRMYGEHETQFQGKLYRPSFPQEQHSTSFPRAFFIAGFRSRELPAPRGSTQRDAKRQSCIPYSGSRTLYQHWPRICRFSLRFCLAGYYPTCPVAPLCDFPVRPGLLGTESRYL